MRINCVARQHDHVGEYEQRRQSGSPPLPPWSRTRGFLCCDLYWEWYLVAYQLELHKGGNRMHAVSIT